MDRDPSLNRDPWPVTLSPDRDLSPDEDPQTETLLDRDSPGQRPMDRDPWTETPWA